MGSIVAWALRVVHPITSLCHIVTFYVCYNIKRLLSTIIYHRNINWYYLVMKFSFSNIFMPEVCLLPFTWCKCCWFQVGIVPLDVLIDIAPFGVLRNCLLIYLPPWKPRKCLFWSLHYPHFHGRSPVNVLNKWNIVQIKEWICTEPSIVPQCIANI